MFKKIFKSKSNNTSNLTTISRVETIDGFSIPAIIRNMDYHFTDLQVYKDGLVYCWDMVDLDLLKNKLDSNWLVTSIPDNERISIFSLGNWKINNGVWDFNKTSFYDYIKRLIKELNPKLENLHNCHGRTTKKKGNVNVSIHGIPKQNPYYVSNPDDTFPEREKGKRFSIFYKDLKGLIYLVDLSIYKNGIVELRNSPDKFEFNFSDLRKKIDDKTLISNLNTGDKVNVIGLGSFSIVSGQGVDIEDKYNELVDEFEIIKGNGSSLERCRKALADYKQNPTSALKDKLRISYESVPNHQRQFVGDMDTKDFEVKYILYGEKAKKEWDEIYGEVGWEFPNFNIPDDN
ncbi:MAG: hypothetical protein ABFS35_21120 [Bacteroidota bacterium]